MPSEFVKNIAKLLSANIIAQFIGIIIYPILTRLYTPDDFGLLNLFMSIGGIAVIFANAEYTNAIFLPKNENKAIACVQIGFIITIAVCIIFFITIPFFKRFSQSTNIQELSNWLWILPIYIISIASWNSLNSWYSKQKLFTIISTYQILQSVIGAIIKLGIGYIFKFGGGLIIGSIIAPFLAIIINISTRFKKNIKPLLLFSKNDCFNVAKEFSNFPKFSLPRTLINYVSSNLPNLMLVNYFELNQIGYFGMALTLAFTPINLIIRSIFQIFFQNTSERVQNNLSIKSFFTNYIKKTLLIAIPGFSILYFILPSLTKFLLGNGWEQTGIYIQFMLPWLVTTILVGPICYLSDIFQQQKIGLFLEILLFITRFIGVCIGIYLNNFAISIVGYCLASMFSILIQLIWYFKLINNYERKISE